MVGSKWSRGSVRGLMVEEGEEIGRCVVVLVS